MRDDERESGIARRLEARARAAAPPRPDFGRLYAKESERVRAKPAKAGLKGLRFVLPYAAAACLALAVGFVLGGFAIPASRNFPDLEESRSSAASGIQNEVDFYLDELWTNPDVRAEAVSWTP
jgi:hypothetical protein